MNLPKKKFTDRSGELPRGLASLFLKQDKFLLKNPGVMNFESAVECADGKSRNYLFSNATFNDPGGKISGITGIMTDITDLTDTGMELSRINEEFDLIITSMPGMIIGVSVKDRITHWNPYTANLFGVPASDVINKRFFECGINWDWEKMYEAISECMVQGYAVRIDELFFTGPDGKNGIIEVAVNPLLRDKTDLEGFIIIGQDITEQKILEGQLLQGRKLEAIGQLAAGVAHEINTPLQYVGDNLRFLNKSFSGILNMLDIIKDVPQNSNEHEIISTSLKQVEELGTKIKLPYLLEEMPKAIEQSLEGINRVSKIIQSMKAFSHPGTGSKTLTDINHSIENTITVSRNEWKYDCDLEFNPDTDLPLVPCFEPEFNQVILNMIVNAVDAVHDAQHNGKIERGRIIIKTSYSPPNAIIIIQDNGTGIPDEIVYKVFDPFFTTKDVGKGTGQGLAISYSIITDKHGGSISIETEKGRGTAFIIKLPIDDEE